MKNEIKENERVSKALTEVLYTVITNGNSESIAHGWSEKREISSKIYDILNKAIAEIDRL
jgi:hypothetical protein